MSKFIASIILYGSMHIFRKIALLVYKKTEISNHISKPAIELMGIVFGFLLPITILLVLYKLEIMHPIDYYFKDVTFKTIFR